MLRKMAYNKIARASAMLILFLLLLLFPVSKEYSLEVGKVKKTISNEEKTVYLLDKNDYVSRCKINMSFDKTKEDVQKLIELLVIDGKYESKIPNGFKPILPSDIKINNIKISEEDVTIDFSSDFNELNNEYDEKALELIVYNLTNIEGIKNVYINIDGKRLDRLFSSNKVLTQPFNRNFGVNKKYNETSIKNITKTTVYYVSKNTNGYYYVPVTKVNNDNRDKIKIIVDELTSSNIYETNLMSLLNYNTKLNDYNIKDGVLTLNFNKYLFDDINSKKVLEEVIYSLCLSIKDNYDVNEVIFMVNNKEIAKSGLKDIE